MDDVELHLLMTCNVLRIAYSIVCMLSSSRVKKVRKQIHWGCPFLISLHYHFQNLFNLLFYTFRLKKLHSVFNHNVWVPLTEIVKPRIIQKCTVVSLKPIQANKLFYVMSSIDISLNQSVEKKRKRCSCLIDDLYISSFERASHSCLFSFTYYCISLQWKDRTKELSVTLSRRVDSI